MKSLIWQIDNYGWSTDDSGIVYPLATKPEFSFSFDALYHEPLNDFFVLGGTRNQLTAAQITEIENFIATVPQLNAALAEMVDAKGMYLGRVPANTPGATKVNSAPWSNDPMRYDFNTQSWILVKAVDSNGNYLGNVALNDSRFYEDVQSVPQYTWQVWDFTAKDWKDGRTLAQLQAALGVQLDVLADQAALRYVTGGQTQSARYQEKLSQCQAYKAAGYPNSATPSSIDSNLYPYVYWESNQTGQAGQAMADSVIAQANAWSVKGGMIEGYRIGGKKAINAATDAAGANTIFNTYANDLGSI